MNKEQKTDLLLRMMEQPEQYTEQQWFDILKDEECRELYTLMTMTLGSMDAARADAALTEDEIEEELTKVKKERVKRERVKLLFLTYRKMAAAFIAAAFLGGLAWAISPLFLSSKSEMNQAAQVTASSQTGRTGGESFSGLRLDSILAIVAAHYDREVCFRDEALCSLQFYTTWDKQLPLDSFLTTLNEFDGLRLSDERDTIFVEKK